LESLRRKCIETKLRVGIISNYAHCQVIRFITIPEMHHNNMPTGSGLWHFQYRLVNKFIQSVVSTQKRWQLLAETGTGRHLIMTHFGNGDEANAVILCTWKSGLGSAIPRVRHSEGPPF